MAIAEFADSPATSLGRSYGMAHIGWVVRDLRGGGAERTILRIADGLCERGHRVDIVLFFPTSDYPNEMPDRASVFVLDRPPPSVEPDAAKGGKLFAEAQEALQEFRNSRPHRMDKPEIALQQIARPAVPPCAGHKVADPRSKKTCQAGGHRTRVAPRSVSGGTTTRCRVYQSLASGHRRIFCFVHDTRLSDDRPGGA